MKLYKYVLDYESTRVYLNKSLKDANMLSDKLIETINIKLGSFFTLLPEGSNGERLYEFEAGVVLPQNPKIVMYSEEGLRSSYSITPTIREELSEILSNILHNQNNLYCVFDDIIRKPNEGREVSSLEKSKFVNRNQVYYILSKDNASIENIEICLDNSDAFWHSLGVITNANLHLDGHDLTEELLDEICSHVQMFFVGAYDGEGYVFWEKAGSNLFTNFVYSLI